MTSSSRIRPIHRALLAMFAMVSVLLFYGCSSTPDDADIMWDTWGVPHIVAETENAALYALGWAQMHSHGDLILRLYGESRGRAAEYWGTDHIDDDLELRTLGIPRRAERWFEEQSPRARAHLEAFTAGLNDYARVHTEHLSQEAQRVLPVRPTDMLAHMQRFFYLDFMAGSALGQSQQWEQVGSNAYAVGPSHSASGNTLLLANPHLFWRDQFLFYEAHIKSPDHNVYGATLVGFPFLLIAFNEHLGWTHTVNTFDGIDLYELTLSDDGNSYVWDDSVRALDVISDTLRVRRYDGSFYNEPLSIRHSIHGPIVAERDGSALAIRLTGRDAAHVHEQYWDMMAATNFEEFESALSRLQMPFLTVIYGDRDGNIMSLFGGQMPERPMGDWDTWKTPVRGDTSGTLWTSTLPYENLPRLMNPETGWVHHANESPWSATYPFQLIADDFPPYLAPREMASHGLPFRPQRSIYLMQSENPISFEDLVEIKHDTGMEMAERVVDDLVAAARSHGDADAREAASVLETWDRSTDADSRGAVLFSIWFEHAGPSIFATAWQEDNPLETPHSLADPERAAQALSSAAQRVRELAGALDVPWGELNRFRVGDYDLPGHGGPDPFGIYRAAWFDRDEDGRQRVVGGDSFTAIVEFGDSLRARVLLPYGNASQPGSRHIGDQLELFANQDLRTPWLSLDDIDANTARRESLSMSPFAVR